MPEGIRATIEFESSDVCPITTVANTVESPIESMDASVTTDEANYNVTEFTVKSATDEELDMTPVFAYNSTYRYRLAHEGNISCPCECLGKFACPIARYVATEDKLTIVFHAADYEELREIINELRERFPSINIKRFIRSTATEQTRDSVLVDRSKLTSRQCEILETAYDMGYFDRPRKANASEIANELDINPSTFREHLAAAQTKLFGDLLK
ncbi:MAG: helix-turn-helix domain-containing protein [Halobacteriaceae archaeon]